VGGALLAGRPAQVHHPREGDHRPLSTRGRGGPGGW
jgi:hypothetical protein